MKAWRGPFNLPTVKISYRTTPKLHLCKPKAHKVNFFNKNLWVFFFAECPVLCLLSVGVVLKVSYIQFLSHQWTTLLGMIADKLGWTPEGRRARGTPKTTCRWTFEKEQNKAGWKSWVVPKAVAQDRKRWSDSMEALSTYWRDETW